MVKRITALSLWEGGGGPGSNGGCSYLGCATEGGCRAVGLDVLLAEPKVSKDNVSL